MIHIHKDRGTGLWHLDQEHGTSDDYATWGEAIEDADYLIATGRRAQEQRQAAEQRTARSESPHPRAPHGPSCAPGRRTRMTPRPVRNPPAPGTPEWRRMITASKAPAMIRDGLTGDYLGLGYTDAYSLYHDMAGTWTPSRRTRS